MIQQLTLNIIQPLTYGFDSFLAGTNQQLITRLRQLAVGEIMGSFFLWGEAGCGKSHLLQAVCLQVQQVQRQGIYLHGKQLRELPAEAIEGLEHMDLVALDDVDALAGDDAWEEALFHFYNRAMMESTVLLFSAQQSPQTIAVALPDLKSRLNAAETYRVQSLSDADKRLFLTRAAQQRGFHLNDEVADFIMLRSARDTASLQQVIERLDKISLSEQRRITVPFVKRVLGI